ncbi:MAG: FAD-binding protein [Actinomycetota bacterium]|nr:FAD-binding protein [Actinomycetota bacterium]
MSGLLAARVLADQFAEVVVVERDLLPEAKQQRRGVPQGRHVHALLARGREVLEAHFPGFTDEVVAAGGLTGDLLQDSRIFMSGGFLVSYRSGLDVLCASRPLLESVVRERVRALDNVRFWAGTAALGLAAEDGRVTGLRLREGVDGEEQRLNAALVVAATGRGPGPLRWLSDLGYPLPQEEEIGVNLTYVTRTFRRRPGDLGGARFLVVTPDPPAVRSAAVFAQEDDLWMVTLIGYLGEQPPTDLDGFVRFAESLPTPELAQLLAGAEPVGEPATAHFPASRRRRFEDLTDLPEGYLVVGDGISSFNPVYGQGMTVAAEESLALQSALEHGLDGLASRFFPSAAKIVDVPWTMAASSDLRFPGVRGLRTPQIRFLNLYVARLLVAAHHDRVVAQAFARTNNLLDSPQSLLRPAIAARVLVGGSRHRPWAPQQRRPDREQTVERS